MKAIPISAVRINVIPTLEIRYPWSNPVRPLEDDEVDRAGV